MADVGVGPAAQPGRAAVRSGVTRAGRPIVAWTSRLAAGLLSLFCASIVHAQAATPREGVDFTRVQPIQPTDAPAGRAEVIEFFGYWCPACNVFEPTLHAWVARNDARIRMTYVPVPTHFRAGQADLQKLYYALDALDREKALRAKVFSAIHVQRSLSDSANADAIADWAAANGIDRKKFLDIFNSFAVQSKVNRANQLIAAYGLTGTPSLGIGGRYLLVVDARTIGNADVLLARALAGT